MCNRGGAVHPGGGHPQVGHDTEADGQDGRGEQRGGEPVDDTWCCCPLGAIAGPDAVSLINGASLDFLARPGKVDGVVQGLGGHDDAPGAAGSSGRGTAHGSHARGDVLPRGLSAFRKRLNGTPGLRRVAPAAQLA